MNSRAKSKSNWILYLAIITLTLAITIFGVLQSSEAMSLNESSSTSSSIRNSLESSGELSDSILKDVENTLNGTNHISKVQIYNVKEIPSENLFDYVNGNKSDYEYSREIWTSNSLFVENLYSGNGSGEWYVSTERRSFHTLSVLCLLLGGFLYTTLFSFWAMKNAYVQNRLTAEWAFVFIIFNVIGYLLFILTDKNRINSNQVLYKY
jgi:hypothetical protein